MRASDQLSEFVGTALASGHDRQTIAAELRTAGWSESEIDTALHAWADSAFVPPVPRPRTVVSAREAFVYGLLFAALLVVCVNVTILGFDLIDRWLPDVTDGDGTRSLTSMRWSIAYLVVFFPVFLVISQRVETGAQADRSRRRSAVRKWFGYITLFLAVIVLLGDTVALIFALLNGDLTSRFVAKTALVAATAGLVLLYLRGVTSETEDAP
ncbi:DUF5671 domain-containing protein [Tropicimonas isoalkanivorans]|uniref:DUF5671 domain-containing protein n=1 Tax=Tropicimonas isoalkanivorans TaxID=441112 RepID=A0A1I1PGH1_9RHOB|nr:DUF5671 domain-containing protein [Tropicimonas isoalkanivorans]SFD06123.1 hypothetical protein SAMN04488094_11459 [Tropicimonas isoalkanivorans]